MKWEFQGLEAFCAILNLSIPKATRRYKSTEPFTLAVLAIERK